MTLLAEKNNLATYIDVTNYPHALIICQSSGKKYNPEHFTDKENEIFSNYVGIHLNLVTFMKEVKAVGLNEMLEHYIYDLTRYTTEGVKRRNRLIIEEIVQYIGDQPKYKEMIESKIIKKGVTYNPFTIHSQIYTTKNHHSKQLFASLDIKKAIFVAYQQAKIITDATWRDFMKRFTNSEFLIGSKKLRLEIFGKLDKGKRNSILMSNLITDVWDNIRNKYADIFIAMEGDEIILAPKNDTDVEKILNDKFPEYINVTMYRIKCVEMSDKQFYVKEYTYPVDKTFELKCLDKKIYTTIYLEYVKNKDF